VESIVDQVNVNGVVMYEVKWAGYSHDENTLEPIENLQNAAEALADFKKARRRSALRKARR